MGGEMASVFTSSFSTNPQSIQLSSAPESIKIFNAVMVALCLTLTGVSLHEDEAEDLNWLTTCTALTGLTATRCPVSPQ